MAVAYSWWTHVAVDEVARIDLSGGSGIVRPAGEADSADARVDRVGLLSPTGGVIDLERNGLTGESCSPMLLFRASLDYRRRAKHPEAKLVFPYQVRNATKNLDDSIRAKLAMARTFVGHAEVVSGKIAVASRLGAERCQPKEIARARDDLDRARRSAADLHLAVDDTEASFARAESSADRILEIGRAHV